MPNRGEGTVDDVIVFTGGGWAKVVALGMLIVLSQRSSLTYLYTRLQLSSFREGLTPCIPPAPTRPVLSAFCGVFSEQDSDTTNMTSQD